MSASSTAIFPRSTNVEVNESDVINSGRDTNHMTYNVLNSVFPDVINIFQHFVAWFRSRGCDPVEISDIVPLQIPSLPITSIADRYTRSMLECSVGYPLYNPKPFSESKEYLHNGVNIGDVGFVRVDGTFDCLFSVCLSQNSSIINPPNLPDGFSLETPHDSETRELDSFPRNTCLFPQTVIKSESDEYTCKETHGATLVLPEGAISAEAIYTGRLEDLAKRYGVKWYEYAKARGRSISNGSLYLVTSFTKCTQWGIAVFDRPCGPGQALTFVSSPLGWKGSGALFTKVSDPKQGDTPNQCVFLRGYKIMIRQDIFDQLPTRQLASRIRGGGGPGGTSLTSRIKKILTGESPLTPTTISAVTPSDEVILQANFNSSPVHRSDLINAELLSQNLDAKVALTHDDVWCDILRSNFMKLNYEALIDIARSYTSTIDQYGCVTLERDVGFLTGRLVELNQLLHEKTEDNERLKMTMTKQALILRGQDKHIEKQSEKIRRLEAGVARMEHSIKGEESRMEYSTKGEESHMPSPFEHKSETISVVDVVENSDYRDPYPENASTKGEESHMPSPFEHKSETISVVDMVENSDCRDPDPENASTEGEESHMPSPFEHKSETIPVADVVELVKILNVVIDLASSRIVMMDTLRYRESPISNKELEAALNELIGYIGPRLCNDLRSKSKSGTEPDLLITEIALQAGLVNACDHIVNNGIPPDSAILSRTHSDMQDVGQAGANVQRAQPEPHTYTAMSQSEVWEINQKYLAGIALQWLTAVGRSLEGREGLPPRCREELDKIVTIALKLHKAISEAVPMMELVTYTVPCDSKFDPSLMEDTEGSRNETGDDTVICTIELGLQCRKRDESGSREEWDIVRKTKVVLSSTLEMLRS